MGEGEEVLLDIGDKEVVNDGPPTPAPGWMMQCSNFSSGLWALVCFMLGALGSAVLSAVVQKRALHRRKDKQRSMLADLVSQR